MNLGSREHYHSQNDSERRHAAFNRFRKLSGSDSISLVGLKWRHLVHRHSKFGSDGKTKCPHPAQVKWASKRALRAINLNSPASMQYGQRIGLPLAGSSQSIPIIRSVSLPFNFGKHKGSRCSESFGSPAASGFGEGYKSHPTQHSTAIMGMSQQFCKATSYLSILRNSAPVGSCADSLACFPMRRHAAGKVADPFRPSRSHRPRARLSHNV